MGSVTRGHNLEARLRAGLQDRGLEWFSALVMMWWSLCLAFPGDTLAAPSFSAFHRYEWQTEELWACIFGAIGGARLVALYINGKWPRTPAIRIIGSAFGLISWAQVAWLITEGTAVKTGVLSTGTGMYALLALADLVSIFRAAFDARYYRT